MARPELFVTDLDGTLLGDDEALGRFIDGWRQHRGRMRLVYASGRFCDSVEDSIRTHRLPFPDAIIGGVGTEIRLFPQRTPLHEWQRRWPAWDVRRVRDVLANFAELVPQPEEFQSAFKTSYFVRDASHEFLATVLHALAARQLDAELIYSSNRDLDILPRGANKGTAAMFLANLWMISRGNVIVAGDSGNDLPLFVPHCRGIIVANAQAELKTLAGATAYLSHLPFADGVLDGLRHWHVGHVSNVPDKSEVRIHAASQS